MASYAGADEQEAQRQLKSTFLLPFHKAIISSLVPRDEDEENDSGDDADARGGPGDPYEEDEDGNALIILAKGLGLRRIVSSIMKIYDASTNLIILVNASSEEEEGLGEELTTLGVRRPGLRVVSHEMGAKKR